MHITKMIMWPSKTFNAFPDKAIKQEEIYWHQFARIHWLSCGDQYHFFFHKRATTRQHKNIITLYKMIMVFGHQMMINCEIFYKTIFKISSRVIIFRLTI